MGSQKRSITIYFIHNVTYYLEYEQIKKKLDDSVTNMLLVITKETFGVVGTE